MDIKLLLDSHVEAIFIFEKSLLQEGLSEIQVEMASWEKPWRKESLEHYCSLGWSFVAEQEGQILGYGLGQPILFFNNWTQTLWIEHLSFKDSKVGEQLIDTMVRWAKSKHLQKVLVNQNCDRSNFIKEIFPKFKDSSYLHLSTTKMSEE